MKKIVVNDTNVFIDLYEVGLLEEFFSLPWEVHTTDFVMLELQREGQHETVAKYKADKRLVVPVFEAKEMSEIGNLFQQNMNRTNLSLTDCSVWYYAKVNNYILLTGDRKLRTVSAYNGVEVRGVIFVFDCLVECGKISRRVAVEKLQQLYSINPRLPKEEIEKRINWWKAEIVK
jgi:rRNA-processing protein FCF1